MSIYSIRDVVAEEFGPIFQAKNDEIALRNYRSALKQVPNPEEYELFYIGTFNVDTGIVNGVSPVFVSNFGVKKDEKDC